MKRKGRIPTKNINNKKGTSSKNCKNNNLKNNSSNIKFSSTVMVNERKKKRRKFKILVVFLFIGIVIAGVYLLLTLPEFNLKNINLNDTAKYSKDEIVAKTGLDIGKNIFIEFFTCDKKNVTTLPYVEDIKLKIKFPNEINISVKERTAKYYAYDKENDKFYTLSEDGYILENVDINSKTKNEILIVGITFDNEGMLGKKINDIDLTKIQIYKKIEKEFNENKINGDITKVSFENSLTTITINDKLNIIFPNDTDLEYKMVFLKTILQSISEDSVGVIDMTKTRPTYSSF